jgi:hypothetical protein
MIFLIFGVLTLPNNTCKPITNMEWVRTRLCKLQKRCTRIAAASDKVYQLLAHGHWFSPGTSASYTTGHHDKVWKVKFSDYLGIAINK